MKYLLMLLVGCLPPPAKDKDSSDPPVDDREDLDGDGFIDGDGDCDDMDSSVNPGTDETWYDGINQNCDGESDYDADGDGYESADYDGEDCDDADDEVRPFVDQVSLDPDQ